VGAGARNRDIEIGGCVREQREGKKKRESADDRAWSHQTQNLFIGIYKRRGFLTRDFILTLTVPIKLSGWGQGKPRAQ
jgi:hypothetical protein